MRQSATRPPVGALRRPCTQCREIPVGSPDCVRASHDKFRKSRANANAPSLVSTLRSSHRKSLKRTRDVLQLLVANNSACQGRTTKSFIGFRELKPATANVPKSFRLNVLAPDASALLASRE